MSVVVARYSLGPPIGRAPDFRPAHALTHPTPQVPRHGCHSFLLSPLTIPCFQFQSSRKLPGRSVQRWRRPFGVCKMKGSYETGFVRCMWRVWMSTAWEVASLHAALLVSVDVHCVGGRFAPCGLVWSPWFPTAWVVASLHAPGQQGAGVSRTLLPNFLSRLSYEGGVNKRSLPLHALTDS